MRFAIISFLCFALFSHTYTQEFSTQDITFLIDLGVEESQIIDYIQQSKEQLKVTQEEIDLLKSKGISQRIIDALTKEDKLSAQQIIHLLESNTSISQIVEKIEQTADISPYSVEDWLLLKRHEVSPQIIIALKNKWEKNTIQPEQNKISLEQIEEWHDSGISADIILERLENGNVDMATVDTIHLLQLKQKKFPISIIRYLANKHLNPENKAVTNIDKAENQENITVHEENTAVNDSAEIIENNDISQKIVSPKLPEAYVKLYPEATIIDMPKLEDENVLSSIKRYFYASLFTSSATPEDVESFYKKHYTDTQVTRIKFNNVVEILKIKFPIAQTSDLFEIRYYNIDHDKLSRLKNLDDIQQKISENNYKVSSLLKEMERKNYLFEIGNISQEQLNKELKKIQEEINLIANTKTYWDYVAIDHAFSQKKGILVLMQPSSMNINIQNKTNSLEKIAKIDIEPHRVDTLAKDFPLVVFPQSQLISHQKIEEALKRASKARSIYKSQFLCNASASELEQYYRKYYPKASVWRLTLNGFLIVKVKFEILEIRSQVEVAFYTNTIGPSASSWETRHDRIKQRLNKYEKTVRNINNEISTLNDLLQQGKVPKENTLRRIDKLERDRYQRLNTSPYWDFTVMDKVMTTQKSVLLISETKQNF